MYKMIRWYDYPVALIVAQVMITMFFTNIIVGAIIAYIIYDEFWKSYCNLRLKQEHGK